ncbi:kinase-like domain-containing protein [Biscogniauxia sp. FL1348]|nr:kinase-like domain-containing protein [Biscogniauxia sp. FL1348]
MCSRTDHEEMQDNLNGGPSPGRARQSRSPSYDSLFDGPSAQLNFDDSSSNKTLSPRPAHGCGSGSVGVAPSQVETPAAVDPVDHVYMYRNDPSYGLKWVRDGLLLRPEWTVEPTIEAIVATLKTVIGPENNFHVEHMHNGTYSKLYRVSYSQQYFVMRISLPVCPTTKTESEVATLKWVYQNTKLPVPRVKCYDASRENPLGFEWILMDHMDGAPLSQCWREISFDAKERIVRQIAAYATSAFEKQFNWGIGNMYPGPATAAGGRAYIGHRRGPFFDPSEWTATRLALSYSDLMLRIKDLKSESHQKIIKNMLVLIERIEALKNRFFHEKQSPAPAPTMLWHDNISLDNLLVDENGVLCGVLDWQCVSCLPLHEACQFPAFLQQSRDRYDEPVMIRYLNIASNGDGQLDPVYWIHLRKYEMTQLRLLFLDEMRFRCPGFVKAWVEKGAIDLRDYEAAVQNCDNEYAYKIVQSWADAIEKGHPPESMGRRLHERLMEIR